MFGNHDYKAAVRIAAEKERELGKKCIVVPSEDEADKWTIGIELKSTTVQELTDRIRAAAKPT